MDAGESSGVLLLVSAPSGGGKTTVCEQLLAVDPGTSRAVTCTTRDPRPGERDGVDYHFLAPAEFRRRIAAGEFLEHARVHGHQYGTLKAEVLDRLLAGRDVLLNVDVQGAAAIRGATRDDAVLRRALVTVFLTPPTLSVLEARLRGRGTESEAAVQQRLMVAREEIRAAATFDYLLLSGSREEDLRRMQAILAAERMRPWRMVSPRWEGALEA